VRQVMEWSDGPPEIQQLEAEQNERMKAAGVSLEQGSKAKNA
jgi:hypothetical protein